MEKEIYSFVSYNLFLSCNALCYDVFFINIYYIILRRAKFSYLLFNF
jgi:hypothetical protein